MPSGSEQKAEKPYTYKAGSPAPPPPGPPPGYAGGTYGAAGVPQRQETGVPGEATDQEMRQAIGARPQPIDTDYLASKRFPSQEDTDLLTEKLQTAFPNAPSVKEIKATRTRILDAYTNRVECTMEDEIPTWGAHA